MTYKHLILVLIVATALPLYSQVEKRYGESCPKLTGDNQCKVCSRQKGGAWTCDSHSIWQEVPGTRLPVPNVEPIKPKKRLTSAGDDEITGGVGSCRWSSAWDKIDDKQSLARLRQPGAVANVTSPAACDQLLAMASDPTSLNRELQQVQQLQGNGQLSYGAQNWSTHDYIQFRTGAIELCRCRQTNPNAVLAGPAIGAQASDFETPEVDTPDLSPNSPKPVLANSESFANSGGSAIDRALDDTLDGTGCSAAMDYVTGGGLQHDLDVATNKGNAYSQGKDLLQQTKNDLLNDSWWAGSRGPVVAAQIKVVCDEVQDWAGVIDPEGSQLSLAKDALIKALDVTGAAIKGAYDNHQSVDSAVRAGVLAANEKLKQLEIEEGQKQIAEALKIGPAAQVYKALKDQEEYVKTLNEAYEYRESVQEHVRNLDEQIRKASENVSIEQEKQQALVALRDSVIKACTQPAVEIRKP